MILLNKAQMLCKCEIQQCTSASNINENLDLKIVTFSIRKYHTRVFPTSDKPS
jgi:hypothetical protein